MAYQISRTVEGGIERIVYTPETGRFQTPILMQHGMFHGAWCWRYWQELFAGWGWETHAFSLPGHGAAPTRRPIRWCTLGYYLGFLKAEVERLPRQPVLMGHSMGGALTQWYLKHAGRLPAAVLVAPWTSHNMLWSVLKFAALDPAGFLLSTATLTTTPIVRNPRRAAAMFITEGALVSPEELHANLGPESLWVLLQYNPLLWSPAKHAQTPMLWLAGGADAVISEREQRRSAAHYGAEYIIVEREGHNLMMERSYRQTAQTIHDWLVEQGIK
ncbi:MAG TPA: alpha/beta fold hydrolase [Thermoflexia bacterium]|nr:alpha/beta fold hydrolase [Thermoflexia bacterium]